MDIKQNARDAVVETRHQQKRRNEAGLERAKEAIESQSDKTVQEEIRELGTQQRQKYDHLQETLLSRAEETFDK